MTPDLKKITGKRSERIVELRKSYEYSRRKSYRCKDCLKQRWL